MSGVGQSKITKWGALRCNVSCSKVNTVSGFVQYSREIGEDARVKTAANIFKSFCYDYRDSLSAGIICAGWDKYDGGQVMMHVWYHSEVLLERSYSC